ncbi:MAG: L,D-transpeptidase [Leptolyngbyaceae cyanobacterium bins.302]|nr:L,D-transpeptidase [Leptolyngbyaceae cyanobacterium bins.302]
MVRRLGLLTSCFIAGCWAVPVQATVVPSIPEVSTPTVVPDSTLPASFQVEPVLPTQPPPEADFDLPTSDNGDRQPQYNETPIKPAQHPLRLEIKLSRRRVTIYRGSTAVKSYAIAVGKPGWETPKGTYKVQQMFRNPAWIHPLKKGITIPGGDPENPLGRYWIGFWTDGKNWIGFHGTPNPGSVGSAASHGCIRMYNKDIEELFQKVSLGMEVKVVK